MKTLQHKFVEFIPEVLEQDVIYISMTYSTAIHLCVCGCGNEVVTPISPVDWQLTFNGKSVSLSPSIGNWNFKCQSHYFIRQNKVKMARRWDIVEISNNRKTDRKTKRKYFKTENNS
jgi:hypothetical protein